MSDRTSKIFNGSGTSLVRTYTDATEVPSALLDTHAYDRLIVYWTCSATDGGGLFSIEVSPDGETWHTCPDEPAASGQSVNGTYSKVWMPETKPGAFARITFHKTSGTTLTLSAVTIEGKS